MKEYFEDKVEKARESFKETLSGFNLLVTKNKGDNWNGCPEANLTYHYAKQYTPYVFFEPPFKEEMGGKYNNHFDAIVWDEEKNWLIIIETKRLFNTTKLNSFIEDVKRIDKLEKNKDQTLGICSLKERLKTQCQPSIKPKGTFALLLTEVWQEKIKDWWDGGKEWEEWDNKYQWDKSDYDDNFNSVLVGKNFPGLNESELYCCYTFRKLDE
ncbi:hypothetical protein UR09_05475 [Candidatus Nitromaritima sp. SCGC AAA799-A02]|nr:hypothetical protein UZ36_07235 [Candidatus Nitromaritima sp. SCGC AAA799-C22]KMP10701.1 hypothetical protein UR09_05475 [Candidatus Nitromaritima sp. SCGC AAA799-A02]